jgi:hypothetical protein
MPVKKMKPIFIDISSVDYPVVPKIISSKEMEELLEKSSPDLMIKTLEEYIDFLSIEIINRKKIVRKNSLINKICIILEFFLVIFDIFLGVYGITFPISNGIILQICVLCTSVNAIIKILIKKIYSSSSQQIALKLLAENRYESIYKKYLEAIQDKIITPEEYSIIVEDFKIYERSLNEIISKGDTNFNLEKCIEEIKNIKS